MVYAKFQTKNLLYEKDVNKCTYLSKPVFKLKIDHEEILSTSHSITWQKNELCHWYGSRRNSMVYLEKNNQVMGGKCLEISPK